VKLSGRTPEPTGKENAESMRYHVPAKKHELHHKHGKPSGNAQTGVVRVVGPGDDPVDARVISRSVVSAFRAGSVRHQSADLDKGERGPDRRGGEYKGSDLGGK
jgi:hypothetical protein